MDPIVSLECQGPGVRLNKSWPTSPCGCFFFVSWSQGLPGITRPIPSFYPPQPPSKQFKAIRKLEKDIPGGSRPSSFDGGEAQGQEISRTGDLCRLHATASRACLLRSMIKLLSSSSSLFDPAPPPQRGRRRRWRRSEKEQERGRGGGRREERREEGEGRRGSASERLITTERGGGGGGRVLYVTL